MKNNLTANMNRHIGLMDKHIGLSLLLFALALTIFACSSDDGGDPNTGGGVSSSSDVTAGGSSSSVGGGSSSVDGTQSSSSIASSSSSAIGYNPPNYANTYKTVIIGNQEWLAENLNYEADGSKCYGEGAQIIDGSQANLTPAKIQENCEKYGRLYDWATAMALPSSCNTTTCLPQETHQGICPTGWHIPKLIELIELSSYIGNDNDCINCVAKHLRSQSGWYNCSISGSGSPPSCEDTYGFTALPSGYGDPSGNFYGMKDGSQSTSWWLAIEAGNKKAYEWSMDNFRETAETSESLGKTYMYSVRCIKD